MNISPRPLLQAMLLLCLLAGNAMRASAGSVVTVTYAGTVNPPGPGVTFPGNVKQGDSISGSLTYNPSQFGNKGNGLYTFTSTSPSSQTLAFQVVTPGYTPATFADEYYTGAYSIQVTDIGSKGATIDIHAVTLYEQSTGPPPVFATADVILTSSTYTGLALPTSTTIGSFVTSPGTLNWDPSGTSFTADLWMLDGQIVPEPSSLVLALLAMGTCAGGFLIRGRKSHAVSETECHAATLHP